MVTATAAEPVFDMGRVFNRTFAVLGRNFLSFFGLGVLAVLPSLVLTLVMFGAAGPNAETLRTDPSVSRIVTFLVGTFGAGFLTLALAYVLQAGLAHGTFADLNGKRASFNECLATGIREFLPLIGIGILSTLGVFGAMLLLVVPGLILAVAWAVVVQVRVVEQLPVMDVFSRSSALTRGHRWAIFGLLLIVGVGTFMLGAMIAPLSTTGLFGEPSGLIYQIIESALRALTSVVSGTMIASTYYELRSIKEGIGAEQLAAVFD